MAKDFQNYLIAPHYV